MSFNDAYVGKRDDVLKLMPKNAKTVLDIGCSTGVFGESIKKEIGASVTGIELSKEMASEAKTRIDEVIEGNIENEGVLAKLRKRKFDVIVLADVLEHLVDPWSTLKALTSYLSPGGSVIISLPNVRHFNTIYNLVILGVWPYRERGIHDKTHLHQFTKKNIYDLLKKADLRVDSIDTNYRIIETHHHLNKYAKFFAVPGLRDFIAYQYLIRAKKI